ncbi:MAG: hypothetical protein IKX29_08090 [Bacteroidales bacterium]|nr:hypothetical protein [Bacteroidales bacterium]
MRTTFKIALASVLVFTLAAAAPELNAQARRSTTTTSTSSSSDNKSAATASRSTASSSSTASRSTSTATRSAGTTANRQSNTSTSTAARQGSTATRNTAAPSGSTSTQVNRRSNSTGTTTTGSQVNRNTGSNGNTGNTGNAAARRNNGTTTSGSTAARQNNGTTRSAGNAAATTNETPSRRVTTTSRSANTGAAEAPTTQNTTPVRTVRSNANATSSNGLTSAPEASAAKANVSRGGAATNNRGAVPNVNYSTGHDDRGNIRMDDNRNLNRIPPRERDFMTHDRPGAFFGHDPHFFGYRVQTLPPRYRRISHWGRDYYFYNNVYYIRYGNWYVITRPPFGVMIDIALRDLTFASVRFSYYHNVYRTFDIVDSNYRTILEQNREIARNNALLARQNSALALNSNRALSAYEIASALGLVQSFANINTEYFYEDGVFYVATKKNRYEVIVPPAGALVNELPDDYDTIVLNGVEYYKVDDTVYRLVLVDGIPALEVLGQMYGDMARKYNYYY